MSSVHSLTIILRRIDQELGKYTSFPLYLSLSEGDQLLLTEVTPEDGLYNYCIDVDMQKDSLFIRPQDAHFDLFLHKQNGHIIHVLRAFELEKGDSLGIDE